MLRRILVLLAAAGCGSTLLGGPASAFPAAAPTSAAGAVSESIAPDQNGVFDNSIRIDGGLHKTPGGEVLAWVKKDDLVEDYCYVTGPTIMNRNGWDYVYHYNMHKGGWVHKYWLRDESQNEVCWS
jgi:hypothetical protein